MFLGCGIYLTTFIIHKVFHLRKRGLIHSPHRGLNCAGLSREVRNVEQSSGGRCRCGYMLFYRSRVVQPYPFRRNIMWLTQRNLTHNVMFYSVCATSRKIHISPAENGRVLCDDNVHGSKPEKVQQRACVGATRDCVWIADTRAATTHSDSGTTSVQPECSLYRFPFCSFSHFSTSSPSLSFLLSFPPRAYTRKIALFLYNAHIRRSYCNLVQSRFRVIGEEKYFHGCGAPTRERGKVLSLSLIPYLFLSSSLSLGKSSSEPKITRSHKFTVKNGIVLPRFSFFFVSV